jgi:isopenicillin-N N-acyltransferase-like protein
LSNASNLANIKIIKVSGNPYEMGFQHGEKCKDLIKEAIKANLTDVITSGQQKAGIHLSKTDILKLTKRYLPYCEDEVPNLIEEVRGIAEGSELPFEDVFALNCFLDLHDLTYPQLASEILFGCTTFAVTDSATVDNQVIIGQTYDISSQFEASVVYLKGRPSDGPEFMVLTMAGCVAWSGLNNQGIGLVINRLTPDDGRPGVPYPFIVRKALSQKTIGYAVDTILRTRRVSGIHYLLADQSGSILGLETSATDYEVIHATRDTITHTNHYFTPYMQKHSKYHRNFAGESIIRLNQSRRFLEQNLGNIGLEELIELTKDHVNYPYSICRHPNEDVDPKRRSSTTASIIMNPRDRRVWTTIGNPCTVPYSEI